MSRLHDAWYDVWDARHPLVVWNLFFVGVSVLILTPLASLLLASGFIERGPGVVANTDIVAFFLTPTGAAWGMLSAAVVVALAAIRFAGISLIMSDEAEGHRPSLFRTVVRCAARAPVLGRLSLVFVGGTLLLAGVLFSGLWVVYRRYLGEFDINYYLSVRPPEWNTAFGVAITWLVVWLLLVLIPVGRSLFALPAVLYRSSGAGSALRSCWQRPGRPSRRAVLQVALALGAWMVLRILLDLAAVHAARQGILLVMRFSPWIRPVVATMGLAVLLSLVLDAVITIAGYSYVSAVVTRAYRDETGERVRPATGSSVTAGLRRAIYRWLAPRRSLPVIVLLFLIGLSAGLLVVRFVPETRDVVISAHRTGPPPAPENTLAALEAAIASGAEFTEIDVQRTVDGTLVIVHDIDLMRVARDRRRVKDLRREDLARIVQIPDDGSTPDERRLATLGEFLDRGADRIRFMIELKYYGFDSLLADEVIRTVRERGLTDQVMIMSLNRQAVEQVRRNAPEIASGFVSSVAIGDVQRLPVDFLAVNRQVVTASLIRRARAQGLEVHAWTVNDPAAMASLIVLGVDGLITDDPARAVAVRDAIAELTPLERALIRFGIGTEVHGEEPSEEYASRDE